MINELLMQADMKNATPVYMQPDVSLQLCKERLLFWKECLETNNKYIEKYRGLLDAATNDLVKDMYNKTMAHLQSQLPLINENVEGFTKRIEEMENVSA